MSNTSGGSNDSEMSDESVTWIQTPAEGGIKPLAFPEEQSLSADFIITNNEKSEATARVPDRNRVAEFVLIREIGRGGMGVVYEALQTSLNRKVALKTLPLAGRLDARQIQRFQNEARASAQLNHPNIVPIYSVGSENGIYFYAMQLIDGHDVACCIRTARSTVDMNGPRNSGETPPLGAGVTLRDQRPVAIKDGPHETSSLSGGSTASLPMHDIIEMMADGKSSVAGRRQFDSVVRMGLEAAEALHHAHQLGIVHRDIKPSNLMLDHSGKLWITDFGLAQVQGAAAMTMTGEIIGTLRYMSPEQPLGQRVLVDQRTDIYSLGVTLYELLTLTKAFDGKTPKEIIRQICFEEPARIRRRNPRVPEELETIVMKAMSKNPEDRYQSAQEMAEDLERFRNDKAILARKPTILQRTRRWGRRNVAAATAIGAGVFILCLLSLGATGLIWRALQAESGQRKKIEAAHAQSEGLRLIANSHLVGEKNPGQSLLLAVRGAELFPGVDANSAILTAIGSNHELKSFKPRNEFTDSISVSPDGQKAVSTVSETFHGKGSFPAVEANLKTGEIERKYDDGSVFTSSAYSPDSRWLLLCTGRPTSSAGRKAGEAIDSECVVSLWSTANGERKFQFRSGLLESVDTSMFSPDSMRVVIPGNADDVCVYTVADGNLASSMKGHVGNVVGAGFNSDGARIFSIGTDKTVRVWNSQDGTQLRQFSVSGNPETVKVSLVSRGRVLMIASAAGTRVFSVESGEQLNPRHIPQNVCVADENGSTLAASLRFGKQIDVFDQTTFRKLCEIRTDSPIISVKYSHDFRRLLVVTAADAAVYEVDDGSLVARLRGHSDRLTAGQFAAEGTHVVTASRDKTVRLWSVKSGTELQTISSTLARLYPSPWSVSPDSSSIAVATNPSETTLVLNEDGTTASQSLSGHLPFGSANLTRLVTYDEKQVLVWNAAASQRLAALSLPLNRVSHARLVPATDEIFITSDDSPPIVWNFVTGKRRFIPEINEAVTSFDVHPVSGLVIVVCRNGDCLLVEPTTAQVMKSYPHDNQIRSVAFSPSGARFLTVTLDGNVRVWDLETNLCLQTISDPDASITKAGWTPDESNIITWNNEKKLPIVCRKAETGEVLQRSVPVVPAGIAGHPLRPVIAITSTEGGLSLWNWETGENFVLSERPHRLPFFHQGKLYVVEAVSGFQNEQERIFGYLRGSEFCRGQLVIRNDQTGQVLSTTLLGFDASGMALDKSSTQLLICGYNHEVTISRIADGGRKASIGRHVAPLVFLDFVRDQSRLVCASMDGEVTLWDQSGKLLKSMFHHERSILSAALSDDQTLLATFDASGKGFLWNLVDGEMLMELSGHPDRITALQFSHSSKQLLSGFSDGSLAIHDLIARKTRMMEFSPGVIQAEWSLDDKSILVATGVLNPPPGGVKEAGRVFLMEVANEKRLELEPATEATRVRWSPTQMQFAVVTSTGTVSLYRTDVDTSPVSMLTPACQPVFDVAFSADGMSLMLMHENESSLWDITRGREVLRVPGVDRLHFNEIMRRTSKWRPFSPDGQWVLTATPSLLKWPRDPLRNALSSIPRPFSSEEISLYGIDLIPGSSGTTNQR